MTGKKNIFAGTLSCKHLEEVADDISEKELTVQVHMVHENPPANKSRLEETKEQTAKGSKLMKFDEYTQYIIEGWSNRKEAKSYWSLYGVALKGKRSVITEVMRKNVRAIYIKLIWE